jgi:hypothetical protein
MDHKDYHYDANNNCVEGSRQPTKAENAQWEQTRLEHTDAIMHRGDNEEELEYESNVEPDPFAGDDANDPIIINSQSTDLRPNARAATLAANELCSDACKPIPGLIRVPNPAPAPSRPPRGFITIGKQGKPTFAQQAKKAQAQQATIPKAIPITGIYSDNDLKNRALSAATIIANAKNNLDIAIDPLLSKPNVIK